MIQHKQPTQNPQRVKQTDTAQNKDFLQHFTCQVKRSQTRAAVDLADSVTREPDGAFKYQLSQPHRSTCYISWEDHTYVFSVTHVAYYKQNNTEHVYEPLAVYEDADCSVNCSRLSDPEAPRPRHENQICFTQQFCRDQVFWLRLIGIVFAVVVVVAVAAVVIYQCVQKRRRRTQLDQVSNTRVAEEVKILLT
ncbi:hypothetical protein F2P81_005151 [Scophthalmus maximus]|uniref:Uncharacterized protein n=1 Tax=Scophthalmus maximus TaxID=52904 RepID=A0A6A4T9W2_SCOMX|nr:hypothetical protein F2P81_005151 [Scophthalmus maximus]